MSKGISSGIFLISLIIALIIGTAVGYFVGFYSMPATGGVVEGLDRPATIPLVDGWYKGNNVTYFDFGTNPSISAPILAFFQQDSPNTPIEGQHNIIDTVPGLPGYTDFWRVYKVLAPADYTPDSIRSFEDVIDAGYEIQETDLIVNCPVVNPDTTVEGSSKQLVSGWYRNREVFYFDFGSNSATNGFIVQTAPIYAFFHADQTPVQGQRNVIDVLPGESGYSDLWKVIQVIVDSSYEANTYKDAAEIQAAASAGSVMLQTTNIYVNCPI